MSNYPHTTKSETAEIDEERLPDELRNRIIMHGESAPYHRRLQKDREIDYEDLHTWGDLRAAFDYLDDDDLRSIDPRELVPEGYDGELLRSKSSGTTGAPKEVYYHQEDAQATAEYVVSVLHQQEIVPTDTYWAATVTPNEVLQYMLEYTADAFRSDIDLVEVEEPGAIKGALQSDDPAKRAAALDPIANDVVDIFESNDVKVYEDIAPLMAHVGTKLSMESRENVEALLIGGVGTNEGLVDHLTENLFPNAKLTGWYGDYMAGFSMIRKPNKLEYAPQHPDVRLEVRNGDDLDEMVRVGERGEVVAHVIRKGFFVPNRVIGDTAIRRRSNEAHAISDIGRVVDKMYNEGVEMMESTELDELVVDRLRRTLSYAQEHSEFWRERFEAVDFDPEEIESIEDMLALPPLQKEDVLANQPPEADDFNLFLLEDGHSYNIDCTTGTTGVEKYSATNVHDEAISMDKVRRGYVATGLDDTTVLANFLPKGLYMSGRQSEDAAEGYVKMHQAFGHTNTPPRGRVLTMFEGTNAGPTAMFTAPSSAERIARELEEYGTDPSELGIGHVMLVGEASSETRREAIAETYNAVVTNNYAMTEIGFTAYQASKCDVDGMHVAEDRNLVMVVNEEEGRLAEKGETGEIWVSTLYVEGEEGATPMFNYKPGDSGTYLGRRDCACGRTHKMVTNVGRSDNVIQANNAKFSPHHVEDILHRVHYREVLTGEYEVKIGEEDAMDTVLIRVDTNDPQDVSPEILREETLADFFVVSDGELQWNHHEISDAIREEFLHAHVAPKAFSEGDLMSVEVDVVEEGTLDVYEQSGKPERIQVDE